MGCGSSRSGAVNDVGLEGQSDHPASKDYDDQNVDLRRNSKYKGNIAGEQTSRRNVATEEGSTIDRAGQYVNSKTFVSSKPPRHMLLQRRNQKNNEDTFVMKNAMPPLSSARPDNSAEGMLNYLKREKTIARAVSRSGGLAFEVVDDDKRANSAGRSRSNTPARLQRRLLRKKKLDNMSSEEKTAYIQRKLEKAEKRRLKIQEKTVAGLNRGSSFQRDKSLAALDAFEKKLTKTSELHSPRL